jgi:proton-translocating NADH-quinone oxidoreductase chain L
MFIEIIFLPLISSLVCGLAGSRFIGCRGVRLVSTSFLIITCLLSFYAFYLVGLLKNPYYISLGTWITSSTLNVDWSFLFDSLTVTMLVVVNTVSAVVHMYSSSYMDEDPHLSRFMSYLSLFTFFMIILVTGNNFLQLFLGWEGVGLCSYLLISFWYTRIQANKAAIKAMLINRVGDFSLLLGIIFIFFTFKSLNYSIVFALIPFFINKFIIIFNIPFNIISIICFLLFIGSVGKSAQIGLHTWLPDAMEGPTPVSALIHAATMVTAGIFLIIRCSPIFEYSPVMLNVIIWMGAATAFFAATLGLVQNDIKKIIAYSTCSQLGYMAFICGTSNYSVGLFHLSNHAFFKALLFLGAGSVIHSLGNEQDIRKMGGLLNIIPFTYIMMLIGSLSLAGFPFLSGFYSKDVILELVFIKYTVNSTFAYWLGTVTALFTAIYSFRLIYLVFLNNTNSYRFAIKNAHELPIWMYIPLLILSIGSVFIGYLTKDMFIGLGTDFFSDSIFVLPQNLIAGDAEFIPYYIKGLPSVLSLLGILGSLFFHKYFEFFFIFFRYIENLHKFYKFLVQKWYFDYIQNELIGKPVLRVAYNIFFKMIDKGFVELLGPTGISFLIYKSTIHFRKFQTGYIYQYSFIIFFFFMIIFIFIELSNSLDYTPFSSIYFEKI